MAFAEMNATGRVLTFERIRAGVTAFVSAIVVALVFEKSKAAITLVRARTHVCKGGSSNFRRNTYLNAHFYENKAWVAAFSARSFAFMG